MAAPVRQVLVLGSLVGALSCHRLAYDDAPWRESCVNYCHAIFECFEASPLDVPGQPAGVDECDERCLEGTPNVGATCVSDDIAYLDCLSDLSCGDLETFFEDPWSGAPDRRCFQEFWTYSVCEE